jgi:hypothetical protein
MKLISICITICGLNQYFYTQTIDLPLKRNIEFIQYSKKTTLDHYLTVLDSQTNLQYKLPAGEILSGIEYSTNLVPALSIPTALTTHVLLTKLKPDILKFDDDLGIQSRIFKTNLAKTILTPKLLNDIENGIAIDPANLGQGLRKEILNQYNDLNALSNIEKISLEKNLIAFYSSARYSVSIVGSGINNNIVKDFDKKTLNYLSDIGKIQTSFDIYLNNSSQFSKIIDNTITNVLKINKPEVQGILRTICSSDFEDLLKNPESVLRKHLTQDGIGQIIGLLKDPNLKNSFDIFMNARSFLEKQISIGSSSIPFLNMKGISGLTENLKSSFSITDLGSIQTGVISGVISGFVTSGLLSGRLSDISAKLDRIFPLLDEIRQTLGRVENKVNEINAKLDYLIERQEKYFQALIAYNASAEVSSFNGNLKNIQALHQTLINAKSDDLNENSLNGVRSSSMYLSTQFDPTHTVPIPNIFSTRSLTANSAPDVADMLSIQDWALSSGLLTNEDWPWGGGHAYFFIDVMPIIRTLPFSNLIIETQFRFNGGLFANDPKSVYQSNLDSFYKGLSFYASMGETQFKVISGVYKPKDKNENIAEIIRYKYLNLNLGDPTQKKEMQALEKLIRGNPILANNLVHALLRCPFLKNGHLNEIAVGTFLPYAGQDLSVFNYMYNSYGISANKNDQLITVSMTRFPGGNIPVNVDALNSKSIIYEEHGMVSIFNQIKEDVINKYIESNLYFRSARLRSKFIYSNKILQ